MPARLTLGGVIALTVHAALLLGLREPPRATTVPDLELEITAEVPATLASEPAGGHDRTAGATTAAVAAMRVVRAPVDAIAPPAVDGTPTSPPRAGSKLGTTVDLGLGRAIQLPGSFLEPPPAAQEPPRADVGAVTDAVHARDLALGLGPEGPILSALIAATQASRAPLHGAATFEATIGADGRIAHVHVVEGADEGWEDACERALEALAGKIANLRGRDGARVRILVTSTTVEPPKGVLGKAGAILFLEPGELVRKQQRSVHARLLSVL